MIGGSCNGGHFAANGTDFGSSPNGSVALDFVRKRVGVSDRRAQSCEVWA
jgi:hypothetical protein